MSSNNNLISLTTVSNLRLEHFRAQHELARNFYDDQEFCPVYQIEEVTEHRERIQKRTSPYPSPSHSPPSYYISPKQLQQRPHINHHQNSSLSSTTTTRAIPIIDPSNMAPVSVPMQQQQQQYLMKANTSPPMAQWIAYKNSPVSTSPTSSNSSISSMSSSSSSSSTTSTSSNHSNRYQNNNSIHNYNNNYYYESNNNNCSSIQNNYNNHYLHQQQPQMMPIVGRAIPIIDPTTRQVYRQQQQTPNIPPVFYNVSVC